MRVMSSIPVRPGLYRFRLYVDDGRLLTWLFPSDRPHGPDVVLVIPPALPMAADQPAAPHLAADGECVWQSTATHSTLAGHAAQRRGQPSPVSPSRWPPRPTRRTPCRGDFD